MKKSILLVALGIFALQFAVAQQFRFGVGGGVMTQDVDKDGVYFLTLNPGVYFPVSKRTSFSLDLPIKAGYAGGGLAPSSYDGEPYRINTSGYAVNIPLMLNFNFGAGAVKGKKDTVGAARWSTINKEEGFGFFVGGGIASHYTVEKVERTSLGIGNDKTDIYYYQSMGLMVNVGIRVGVGPHKRHSCEFRYFYMKGTTNEKPDVWGLSISYVL